VKEGKVNKALTAVAALVAALAVSIPGAFGKTDVAAYPQATPGVTKTQIVIGGTFPLSGPVSSYAPIARGHEAYFNYINARKGKDGKTGIHGRKIVWKYYDDAYNPANAVQLTNKLILEDKVFAVFSSLGTEVNQAIRPLLNQRKVPQLFVSTGASYWGLQYKEFPWTIGWQPDYIAEGRAYGAWIGRNKPNAKIAVFFQNDDYGKDYLRGLKIGLGAKKSLIVSELGYEVTDSSYASQIARQKASSADTWVLLTTAGTPTVRAIATAKGLNWKPDTIVLNSVAATDAVMAAAIRSVGADFVAGTISSSYQKSVSDPKYANDPAVKQYRSIMAKYGPSGADANNQFYYYGVAKAYDLVRVLSSLKNPTRPALMRAVTHMNWKNPFLLTGMTVKTTRTDHFPISQIRLTRFQGGHFLEFGPLIKGR
jgi:branched-chain amino acid transport system substrate-binding protein